MHTYKQLTITDIQVILASLLGDGSLYHRAPNIEKSLVLSSIKRRYLMYKCLVLATNIFSEKGFKPMDNSAGYKKGSSIYQKESFSHPQITFLGSQSPETWVSRLDECGLALWFFDDGSLHQKKKFYNLYTNSFSVEQVNNFIGLLQEKFGLAGKLRFDRKKDGRCFPYIYFGTESAKLISKILMKYSGHELDYKIIPSSTTIPKGSRAQEGPKQETSEK